MIKNENLVPEMRASLDRMTTEHSGESKTALVNDYKYAVTSGRPESEMSEEEKRAVSSYTKHILNSDANY